MDFINNHYHLMNAHESFASFDTRIHDLEQLNQDGQDPNINVQLVALKTKRNAMTPFCAAPSEIIGRILAVLARWPRETDGFFEIKHFRIDSEWIVAMSVCSRIRWVAIHTPVLWSLIDGETSPSWMKLCIQRAGTHPVEFKQLSIFRLSLVEHRMELASHILNVARSAEIVFSGETVDIAADHMLRLLDTMFSNVSPQLSSLDLSCRVDMPFTSEYLYGLRCSNLIELSLSHVFLGEPPSFPRLQRLKIENVQHGDDDWTSWLVFLRDMPSLEVLFLYETGLHTMDRRHAEYVQMMRAGSSINMPHLRVLSINDSIYAANLLVTSLPMPSHSLSIVVDFMYQHALPIPPQHDHEELHDILFDRVCEFWKTTSTSGGGSDVMPVVVLPKFGPGPVQPSAART